MFHDGEYNTDLQESTGVVSKVGFYKRGIAGSVNFRKCRVSAQKRTRIWASFQKKTVCSANLQLKVPRHFSGAFKRYFFDSRSRNVRSEIVRNVSISRFAKREICAIVVLL